MATKHITTPKGAAEGLDLFAAAWLERWHSYGGTVQFDLDSGKAATFLPEPSLCGATGDPAWSRAFRDGATAELRDLLDMVPGGWDALKQHVLDFPEHFGRGLVSA